MAANTWKKGVHYYVLIIIVIDALTRVDQEIVSLKGANKLLFHLLLCVIFGEGWV